ncbi:MAG: sigma 54-interacting transcriptional regulator [Kiritimatiellae bacterium]|nr:sigma 54-interacting transcriptional regulator [Kiritimatiellia bacterium]
MGKGFNRMLVAESVQMRKPRALVDKVAAHRDARVLILGTPWTGKELVAQAIHSQSERRDGPFRAFNSNFRRECAVREANDRLVH